MFVSFIFVNKLVNKNANFNKMVNGVFVENFDEKDSNKNSSLKTIFFSFQYCSKMHLKREMFKTKTQFFGLYFLVNACL